MKSFAAYLIVREEAITIGRGHLFSSDVPATVFQNGSHFLALKIKGQSVEWLECAVAGWQLN